MVNETLVSAIEVFAERGYAGLSFEEVASRAGVNKTTVYRRWPTKVDLLRAAMHHARDAEPPVPNHGDLRADLLDVLRSRVSKMSTPRGRSVARAIMFSANEPELAALLAEFRRERPSIPRILFERAIARGELPAHVDAALLTEVLVGAVHGRIFLRSETVSDAHLRRIIDLVLSGAQAHERKR